MSVDQNKPSASEALKRALEAKKAKQGGGFSASGPAKAVERTMQRQAAAMNKPAFRKASKRG